MTVTDFEFIQVVLQTFRAEMMLNARNPVLDVAPKTIKG